MGSLVGELWCNLASQWFRSSVLFLVAIVTLALPGAVEAYWTAQLVAAERDFISEGGATATSAPAEGVSTSTCKMVARQPFATGGGGFGFVREIRVGPGAGRAYRLHHLTRHALDAIAPGPRPEPLQPGAVVLGPGPADDLGLGSGDLTTVEGEVRRVRWVIPRDQLRVASLARSVLVVQDHVGVLDECYVNLRPSLAARALPLAAALLEPRSPEAVTTYTQRGSFSPTPTQALRDRPHRLAWLAAGAMLGLAMSVEAWARREEFGLLRAVGMSPRSTVLVGSLERLILVIMSAGPAIILSLLIAHVTEPLVPDQVRIVVRAVLGAAAVAHLAYTSTIAWISLRWGPELLKGG